jgi:cyclin-dependent kinase 8/11
MGDEWSSNTLLNDPMRAYRARRDAAHQSVTTKYTILGFISSGTYGRVYKAQSLEEDGKIHAIKKFKPDKEGDVATYNGISQSAIREIAVSLFSMLMFSFDRRIFTCSLTVKFLMRISLP